uniref:aralkylamine N-acetyltransferase n=1 Tax=Steinernema glaseri TaxID=37863 RepID=A0A1I8AU33_9BILA
MLSLDGVLSSWKLDSTTRPSRPQLHLLFPPDPFLFLFQKMPPFESKDSKEDLRVVRLIKADRDAVVAFMQKEFRRFEPLTASLDPTEAEAERFIQRTVDYCLKYPISFAMKKEDGTIVGICLNTYLTRPKEGDEEPSGLDDVKTNEVVKIVHFLRAQEWKILPQDIKNVVDVAILTVDSAYARRGIACTLLKELNEEKIKAEGVQGLVSELTNVKSQNLLTQKFGFKEIYSIDLADWKDDQGRQIFECSKFDTYKSISAFKAL